MDNEQTTMMPAVPRAPAQAPAGSPSDRAMRFAVDGLSDAFPNLSVRSRFSMGHRVVMTVLGVAIVGGFVVDPVLTGSILMTLAIGLYTLMLAMRIDLARRGRRHGPHRFTAEQLAAFDDDALPTFTILVPAYKEPEVIAHLVDNLAALDYPTHLLEIKLLLEDDDAETIAAAAALGLSTPFEVVIVPPGGPRTKPKALNYALPRLHWEIVICIYDAEDRPDPLQLPQGGRDVRVGGCPSTRCVQAELAYYNADENIITRWFAIEYRMWFTQFLPALSATDAPIPLGGTSNHIRRDLLIELGALGPVQRHRGRRPRHPPAALRLPRARCSTRSRYEEANTDFVNWVKQRSRWYKGYLQTWLVHMRHPRQLLQATSGFGAFVRFNLFVGGTPLLAMLNPISWVLLVMWFMLQPHFIDRHHACRRVLRRSVRVARRQLRVLLPEPDGGVRVRSEKVFMAALRLPVYWVMMSIAAVKALCSWSFNPTTGRRPSTASASTAPLSRCPDDRRALAHPRWRSSPSTCPVPTAERSRAVSRRGASTSAGTSRT